MTFSQRRAYIERAWRRRTILDISVAVAVWFVLIVLAWNF